METGRKKKGTSHHLSYPVVVYRSMDGFINVQGEISDYYFVSTRFPTLLVIGYCIDSVLSTRKWYLIGCVSILVLWFAYNNISWFWRSNDRNFMKQQERAQAYIRSGERMDFQEGIAESYLYFYYRNFDMR